MTVDICLLVLTFSVCLAVCLWKSSWYVVSSVLVNRRTSYAQVSENNGSDNLCYSSVD